jgi:hypothetical protein
MTSGAVAGFCNWSGPLIGCRWEKLGPSVIEKGYRIGCSSDFWNRYEEDIGIAKSLGEHTQPWPAFRRLQPTAAQTCSYLLVISIPHAGSLRMMDCRRPSST